MGTASSSNSSGSYNPTPGGFGGPGFGGIPGMGGPGGGMPASGARSNAPSTVTGPGLTQHVCNKDYDVVQYKFTVMMPARHIPALQSNLMQRNFHTIIKVIVGNPESAVAANSAPQPNALLVPQYCGPDAVIEVTFFGELLLLNSWERGTFDAASKSWTMPPLIPAEVLKKEFQDVGATSALRPEDIARINEGK
jgi:hypothetical protein